MQKLVALALGVLVLLDVGLIGADGAAPDLSRHFTGIRGTFVLLNGTTGAYTRYNELRATQRFAPCSTFKIPNTAILLDSGTAPNPDYVVKYDPALQLTNPDWARDHTLASAFKDSALWYYQALARRLGVAAEQKYLHQFHYGNEDASGGVDKMGVPFWVDGSLTISADEQVDFLRKFYTNKLGLSERATRLTKNVILGETTDHYRLSAKTGACQPAGQDAALWYVGYVEKNGSVYYFGLEMGDTTYDKLFDQRVTKARAILTELGIL